MIQWILNLIFCFLFFSCTPTNENLTELTGGETTSKTKTVPAEFGNQSFSFTPASWDFGNRAVNAAPITKTVTIKNISSYDVYLSSVTGPAASFNLVSDDCPRSPTNISPNQSCSAVVSFAPIAGGTLTSSLTLNYGPSPGNTTVYSSTMGLSGTGVGTLSFTGISSVSDIYSSQLKLNWTHVAGALTYYVFRVNADGSQTLLANVTPPTATYIVSGLSASTSYKYWVRATDTLGAFDTNANVVTTSTNTTPPAPVISAAPYYTFASMGAIALGSTLSYNFDDVRTGVATDTGITYSCYYDQLVDSSVGTSNLCSSLPGTFSMSTTSGAIAWTPTTQASIGFYEFRVRITDNTSSLTSQAIFVANIKPTYSTTNLIGNYSAMFSSGATTQSSINIWQDLTANNSDGTLTNFTHNGTTLGWLGLGTTASPYRLVFDGSNDYVDLSSMGNTATSVTLSAWVSPTQISTSPVGIIMGNADSSAKGIVIREAKGYRNRIESFAGGTPYVDEVLTDLPISYLRMGETSGSAIYDFGSQNQSWTVNNLSNGYEKTGAIHNTDKSIQFNGTNTAIRSAANYTPSSANWAGFTWEAWVSFSSNAANQTMFSQNTQDYTNGYYWLYHTGAQWTFQNATGVAQNQTNYVHVPVIGTWYHIAVSVDYTTRAFNFYINGVNVKSATIPLPYVTTVPPGKIAVGAYQDMVQFPFNGYMDEVAYYDHVVSGARILAHYNARNNVPTCLSKTITESTWNHLATTWDHATQSLKLYTNSNYECQATSSAINLGGTSAQMSIGAKVPAVNSPTAGTFFKGAMTDARIYDAAISTTQVGINMASQIEQFDIPNSVAGLNLWLKADAITGLNNGDPVSTWSDVSAHARSATQAGAARPTYIANAYNGKPAIRFDGVDDQMPISGTQTSWTMFVVAKITAGAAGTRHIVTGNPAAWLAYASTVSSGGTTMQWYMDPPGWASYQTYATTIGTTVPRTHTFRGTTTTAQAYLDGVLGINNTGGPYTAGYVKCLGNYNCADVRWFYGDIFEVLAYSGTLTDAERQRIEGYLKAKYGL